MHENEETLKGKRVMRDAGRQIVDIYPASWAEMASSLTNDRQRIHFKQKLKSKCNSILSMRIWKKKRTTTFMS
jgi:hypothetical protein